MSTFAENLKTALNHNGMRPLDLSIRSGVSKSSISYYMSGRCIPKHEKLAAIASALGVSEAWLLGDDIAPSSAEEDLTALFRSLDTVGQQKLIEYAEDLVHSGRYTKKKAEDPAV